MDHYKPSNLDLFNVPHLALGGELSKDQHERSQLFSANAIFGLASGAGFATPLTPSSLLTKSFGHLTVP